MEAVEKKVELVEKAEGPMADRVMEIVQKEIGEERERRIREWNVVIRGMNEVSLREDEKEEQQGAVGGINPPPREQKMDQQQKTVKKVEELLERGLKLPNITIKGTRNFRNKDVVVVTLGSREEKYEVLDKARSLNRNARYKYVYVTQDMTRKEQEIDYHLRKELKERRDKGGKTWS